ncbi:MAG: hypothetical protein F6K09_01565 [Merismopedia sp. SIO2A8]|nr:hypothetical protein [Merismopedia sp. SIO2A8]
MSRNVDPRLLFTQAISIHPGDRNLKEQNQTWHTDRNDVAEVRVVLGLLREFKPFVH